MRNGAKQVVAVALASLLAGVWWGQAAGQQQRPTASAAAAGLPADGLPPGCLQVVSNPGEPITAVVYDPQQQVLGVYHVDRASGEIELKSIRQIEWDLQMLHYQGKAPLPEDVRSGLKP